MSLPIISADERLAEMRGVKAAIFGASGRGKTTLLRTLNSTTTSAGTPAALELKRFQAAEEVGFEGRFSCRHDLNAVFCGIGGGGWAWVALFIMPPGVSGALRGCRPPWSS